MASNLSLLPRDSFSSSTTFSRAATTDVLGGNLSLVPPRTQLLVAHTEESDLRLSGLYLQVIVIDSSTRLDSGFYFILSILVTFPTRWPHKFGASPNLVCQERQTLNPVQKSRSDQRHNDISMGGSAAANIHSVAALRTAKQSFLASPFQLKWVQQHKRLASHSIKCNTLKQPSTSSASHSCHTVDL